VQGREAEIDSLTGRLFPVDQEFPGEGYQVGKGRLYLSSAQITGRGAARLSTLVARRLWEPKVPGSSRAAGELGKDVSADPRGGEAALDERGGASPRSSIRANVEGEPVSSGPSFQVYDGSVDK